VSLLVALSKHKAKEIQCYAPNEDQAAVVNHKNNRKDQNKRNILAESARIARGNIKDLKELKVDNYDAVFFPGGFGVAMNLSNFGSSGEKMEVNPRIEKILKDFHRAQKAIGLCCISPILGARVFGRNY
jgi:enhancing lycopene biosynthesis protein 2